MVCCGCNGETVSIVVKVYGACLERGIYVLRMVGKSPRIAFYWVGGMPGGGPGQWGGDILYCLYNVARGMRLVLLEQFLVCEGASATNGRSNMSFIFFRTDRWVVQQTETSVSLTP